MAEAMQYLPVTADDANRQQQVARTFFLLGNFLAGVDDSPRMEPGNVNQSGMLGPQQSGPDVGIGQGGEVYLRGRAVQIGANQNAPQPAQSMPGLLQNPLVLLGLAGLAFWLFKRA